MAKEIITVPYTLLAIIMTYILWAILYMSSWEEANIFHILKIYEIGEADRGEENGLRSHRL